MSSSKGDKKRKSADKGAEVIVIDGAQGAAAQAVPKGFVVPEGYERVTSAPLLDLTGVETGQKEVWLVQLPSKGLQQLAQVGKLEVDMLNPDQVASLVLEGEQYHLAEEQHDMAQQAVLVCPSTQPGASAKVIPVKRRLTLMRAPDSIAAQAHLENDFDLLGPPVAPAAAAITQQQQPQPVASPLPQTAGQHQEGEAKRSKDKKGEKSEKKKKKREREKEADEDSDSDGDKAPAAAVAVAPQEPASTGKRDKKEKKKEKKEKKDKKEKKKEKKAKRESDSDSD